MRFPRVKKKQKKTSRWPLVIASFFFCKNGVKIAILNKNWNFFLQIEITDLKLAKQSHIHIMDLFTQDPPPYRIEQCPDKYGRLSYKIHVQKTSSITWQIPPPYDGVESYGVYYDCGHNNKVSIKFTQGTHSISYVKNTSQYQCNGCIQERISGTSCPFCRWFLGGSAFLGEKI